jgi:hypothetical protein
MKFVAVFLLAFVAAAIAAPTSISDNNIGNIVTVGIKGSIDVSNKVDQDIVNVIIAILNQQGIVIAPGSEAATNEVPKLPENFKITPEMIDQVKQMLA